eukprot:COSAG05_NODE_445_length_9773_cov_4.588071_9_plen_543_part_00
MSLLSEGANGKIWRVDNIFPPIYCGTGAPFREAALKVAKSEHDIEEDTEAALIAEIKALQEFDHPNIVKALGRTYGATSDDPDSKVHMLLLELCASDLTSVIRRGYAGQEDGQSDTLDWESRLHIISNIAAGLSHIHAHDKAHLDLKPGNVLIQYDSQSKCITAKLADFGEQFDPNNTNEQVRYGTPEYMAPEAWHRKYGTPGTASDVFSFGVILWEIYSKGQRPYTGFEGAPHENMPQTVSEGKLIDDINAVPRWYAEGARPVFSVCCLKTGTPLWCPEPWQLLAKACWNEELHLRPSFEQVQEAIKSISFVKHQKMAAGHADQIWVESEDLFSSAPTLPQAASGFKSKDRARAWLEALGFLSASAIEAAVSYVQVEGNGELDFIQMDDDDVHEMMADKDEMNLDGEAQDRFHAALDTISVSSSAEVEEAANSSWQAILSWLDERDADFDPDFRALGGVLSSSTGTQSEPTAAMFEKMRTEIGRLRRQNAVFQAQIKRQREQLARFEKGEEFETGKVSQTVEGSIYIGSPDDIYGMQDSVA